MFRDQQWRNNEHKVEFLASMEHVRDERVQGFLEDVREIINFYFLFSR